MIKAQNHLRSYNKKSIIHLDIGQKQLKETLKLKDFINLRKLDCSRNQITSLEIINCPNLEIVDCLFNKTLNNLTIKNCPNLKELDCRGDSLKNLDLSQNTSLEKLNISSNNFSERDLSFLRHMVNLKEL